MPLQSVTGTVENDLEEDLEEDLEDSQQVRRENFRASRSLNYRVSKLIPLSTSPAWDEVKILLTRNIRLTGSDSLTGFCDEAHFARSHLKKTMTALLKGSTQAKAALFCVKQMQSEDITEDLKIAFAKLLPHSLLHAEELLELRFAILRLRTRYQLERFPAETRKAIADYSLNHLPPQSPSSAHLEHLYSPQTQTGKLQYISRITIYNDLYFRSIVHPDPEPSTTTPFLGLCKRRKGESQNSKNRSEIAGCFWGCITRRKS